MVVLLINLPTTIREKGFIKSLLLTVSSMLILLASSGLGWYFAKEEVFYVKDTAVYLYRKIFPEKLTANEWQKVELEGAGTIYLPSDWNIIKHAQATEEVYFNGSDTLLDQRVLVAQTSPIAIAHGRPSICYSRYF